MPYFRGTRLPLLLERDIEWLLNENFTSALPPGSVNGTNAEPGPGVRTVVDTASHLSITGGKFTTDGGASTWADPGLWLTPGVTRTPGRFMIVNFNRASGQYLQFGWDSKTTVGEITGARLYFGPTTNILGSGSTILGTFASSKEYSCALIQTTAGGVFFIKGDLFTNWTMIYKNVIGTDTPLYPAILGYNAVFTSSFLRVPTTLFLPVPLLSTSGAMTWPTTNGLGHAETTGLGSGGSGLTLTDAGTWSVAGGYVLNTPVAGVELIVNGSFTTDEGWSKEAGWTIDTADSNVAEKAAGANNWLYEDKTDVGIWYRHSFDVISITAGAFKHSLGGMAYGYAAVPGTYVYNARATNASYDGVYASTALTAGTIDNVSIKPLPISQLITNVALSTTDVLAEQVIHAFTLGTQVGMAMNLDRSFAAKAAALASAGQAILSLKEVTGVGGVGLAATDELTVNGVTYTLTVAGAGTVAYDDVAKTQTVVLSANLAAEVLADAKVGLDWAAWNGVLCYFDGAGNIRVDEVKAGVYTSRGSTATAFVADKRLIVRKVGTEYRWFFNEALVTSTTAVDAAAMAGKYHGMFSTLGANTITSMVVYDTGAVTNLYSNLDKYSA